MKMIHYSLIATYVAVFAAVDTPDKAISSDQLDLRSAIPAIGSNEPLLAQADVGSKKPGAKGPKVNVDQNGVILRGYDPVAYFKQNKRSRVTRNIQAPTEERLTISRLGGTKLLSTKLQRIMPRSTAVFARME
jgi:hypothetical protein